MTSFDIGTYKLEMASLGQDGIGALFAGTDSRSGEAVFVKEMRRWVRDGDATGGDAESLAGVLHPSLVHPCDQVDSGGTHYAVVARPEGELLSASFPALRSSGLKGRFDLLNAILDVCDGVDALHRAGLVSGGINPTAIVVQRGSNPRAFLLNFGPFAARPTVDYLEGGDEMVYVAQEQLRGAGGAASDIYSLGMLLYMAFSRRPPYEGGSPYQVAEHIVWGDLIPFVADMDGLGDVERRAIGSAIEAIGDVATRALQRGPSARYASVSEMRSALKAIADRLSPIELGLSLFERGEFEMAAEILEEVSPGRDYARAHIYLGRIYGLQLGRYEDGVIAFKRALNDSPTLASAREGLAELYSRFGKHSLAKAELLELLTTRPDDAQLMMRYARVLEQAGDKPAALNVLHRLQQLNPYFLPAYSEAIGIAMAGDDQQVAETEVRHALEHVVSVVQHGNLDPEQVAGIYFLRAQLWWKQGRSDRAMEWAEKALVYMPFHEPSHSLLAQLYNEAGDTDKAVQHLLASMRLKPDQESILEGIARIYATQQNTGGNDSI
jgi:tetratricopeptide (TPR) repeat protein